MNDKSAFQEKIKNNTHTITFYTDGACSGNPGPGGWGVLALVDGERYEWSGGERDSTNNRMEMMAAAEALSSLPQGRKAILVTDSTYLRDGITSWILKWKSNNWMTSTKKPVKNKDLWERIDALNNTLSVQWKWIKAHNGHEENERADLLARQGILALQMRAS
jgi:ribonuclease HI